MPNCNDTEEKETNSLKSLTNCINKCYLQDFHGNTEIKIRKTRQRHWPR